MPFVPLPLVVNLRWLQMLRREFARMAHCCSRAVEISQQLVASDKEQAYQDDLRRKNIAFQEAVSPYLGAQPAEVQLSEYLDIIGSTVYPAQAPSTDELEFSFMESQGGDLSASFAEC
jgi:hypothetical protein